MRVLAISSYGVLGGAEIAMSRFLAHRPAGVEARALVVDDGPLVARLVAEGIPTWSSTSYKGSPGPREAVHFARALGPVLDAYRPDVVWACGQKGALLSVAACRPRRIPLVWHKVDFSHDRKLAKPLALACDGVVSVSDAVVEALGPDVRRRRHLGAVGVPVPMDPGFRGTPDVERPLLGTLARLVPYKGIHHMVRALALVREEVPGARLLVAGGPVAEYPDYPAELEALVAELGLQDAVELRGFVSDVGALLAQMSVFLNATYRDEEGFGLEGMPGSILEAAWVGVPTVAPGQGGNVEAVVDGETGTLVDEPEPGQLAAAILPYLADQDRWRRASDAAAGWAREHHSPPAAAGRLFGALRRAAS